MVDSNTVLEDAQRLVPRIRALGAVADTERRLPAELVGLMTEAGLFRILQPRVYGGLELAMLDALDVIETVSYADGSAGWCLLKGATTNQLAAYLSEEGAREIWSAADTVTAGSFNPKGRASRVEGGWRLTGRWDWGTGAAHSRWIMAGAVVTDDAPSAAGAPPQIKTFFVPREEVELIDTWRAHGLRGTGSVDFAVQDVFVPERRVFDGLNAAPVASGPISRVPLPAQIMVPHAAVALGLARGVHDAFLELAIAKTPLLSTAKLADDRLVHDQLGRARAAIAAAKAFVRESVQQAWSMLPPERPATEGLGALSLSAVHATHACVEAVDRLYTLAGGSAVHETSPIQKSWRDLHVAASHFLVAHDKFSWAGAAAVAQRRAAQDPPA